MTDVAEPVELHGAKTGNCFRAAIALEEAGIPYRVRLVDLGAGEHRGEVYGRLNPAGKVPTLVDRSDGAPFALTQSNAIVMWAAERAPGVLIPVETGPARDRVMERFFYFVTDAIARSHAAFALARVKADAAAIAALDGLALEALAGAERFVAEAPFMAGQRFSIADIAGFTIAKAYEDRLDWAALPALARWYEAVGKREAGVRGMKAFDPPPA